MSRAPTAIQRGFLYQAYFFWSSASRLFFPHTKVVSVGYEINNQKGFDDVVARYNPPIRGEFGGSVSQDFYQIKFHQDYSSSIAAKSLIDPTFIGSTATSLLQRTANFLQKNPSLKGTSRVHLVTPWGLDSSDSLSELVCPNGGEIRIEKFEGVGPNSNLGKILKEWQDHLGVKDRSELLEVLTVLRLLPGFLNLVRLKEDVSRGLEAAGLQPIDPTKATEPYSSLIFRLCDEGRNEFTKAELLKELTTEGLVIGEPKSLPAIGRLLGVRSFFPYAEHLEDLTEAMLPLEGYFEGRFIRDSGLWNTKVAGDLETFVDQEILRSKTFTLYLDCHSSIALALGSKLDLKAGIQTAIVQKGTSGPQVWTVDNPAEAGSSLWDIKHETLQGNQSSAAVAISLAQPIDEEVKQYIQNSLPQIGQFISLQVKNGAGGFAVKNGNHAWRLAEEAANQLKSVRTKLNNKEPIHLFFAVPNAVAFFLGRQLAPAGAIQTYEFDFKRQRHGTYEPSILISG